MLTKDRNVSTFIDYAVALLPKKITTHIIIDNLRILLESQNINS